MRISDWSSDVCSSDLHHHAAFAGALRRQVLERDFDAAGALGYVDVERVDVQRVALPWQGLAVGGHLQAGQLVDRAARRVVARQPLRIQQGQRSEEHRSELKSLMRTSYAVSGLENK